LSTSRRLFKKAIAVEPLIAILILVVVLGGVYQSESLKKTATDLANKSLENLKKEPPVFDPELNTEEQVVMDSVNGLIKSINYLVSGETVNKFSDRELSRSSLVDEGSVVHSYEITYYAELQKPTASICKASFNKDDVTITKPYDIEEKFSPVIDHYIWADSKKMDCNDRIECLDKVCGVTEVNNFKLTTYDQAGNMLCQVDTIDKGEHKDKDLQVWGLAIGGGAAKFCPGNSDFRPGDGCDRNGNGIYGEYGPRFDGVTWQDTLEGDQDKDKKIEFLTSSDGDRLRELYFQGGRVKAGSGEGCFDSPTYLECTGVRVYYCGRWGKGKQNPNENEYFRKTFDENGNEEYHSAAGAKFMAVLGPKLTEETEAFNRLGEENIVKRVKGKGEENFVVGQHSFQRGTFVDYFTSGGAVHPFSGDVDMADSATFCQGGKVEGAGNVMIKCMPDIQTCGMCGFHLPQEIPQGDGAVIDHFSGVGDPKYLIYYESFPLGEEEGWEMEPFEMNLYGAAVYNVVWNSVGAGLKVGINKGSKIVKTIQKAFDRTLRFVGKKPAKTAAQKLTERLSLLGLKDSDELAEYIIKKQKGVKFWADAGFPHNKAFVNFFDDPEFQRMISKTLLDLGDDTAVQTASEAFVSAFRASAKKGIPWALSKQVMFHTAAFYTITHEIMLEESKLGKFDPIGSNNIGSKSPFQGTMVSGNQFEELDPEVEKYFLSLVRDHRNGGPITKTLYDQGDQRLFFASPCKANLALWIDKCACYEVEGPDFLYVKFTEPHDYSTTFEDGYTPVFAESINPYDEIPEHRYENATKVCPGGSWFKTFNPLSNPVNKVDCVRVDPAIIEGYCYGGSDVIAQVGSVAIYGATMVAVAASEVGIGALSVAVGAGTAGTGTIIVQTIVKSAVATSLDYASERLVYELNKDSKWPNHPGLTAG